MNAEEIGRTLRTRREELHLSVDQVQEETKIRRRYLVALEQGRLEDLPAPVYARGFLRSYASFLGLDGTALLRELDQGREPPREEPTLQAEPAAPPPRAMPGWRLARRDVDRRSLGWIIGVLLLLLAIYFLSRGAAPSKGEHQSRPPTRVTSKVYRPPTVGAAKVQLVSTSASRAEAVYTVVSTAKPAIQSTLRFRKYCWVMAVRDGRTLFQGFKTAGEQAAWSADRQLYLRVGVGDSVSLAVDGVSVPTPSTAGAWTFIFRAG